MTTPTPMRRRWQCGYCHGLNLVRSARCSGCGRPRTPHAAAGDEVEITEPIEVPPEVLYASPRASQLGRRRPWLVLGAAVPVTTAWLVGAEVAHVAYLSRR